MRFAAIADVHGNLHALNAVLDDIAAQGVADVVNLGDHVSGVMLPAETADRLIACNFTTIRGDQERILLDLYRKGPEASDRPDFQALQPYHFEWMAAQPATLLYRGDVFLCHGSPRNDACYWLDRIRPDGGIEMAPLAAIEAEAEGIAASLILCAHTHLPRAVRLSDGRIAVNPGSIGLPGYRLEKPVPHTVQTGTPNACYAILEREQGGWSTTFRQVPYDATAMAELAARSGLPEWGQALTTGWIDNTGLS